MALEFKIKVTDQGVVKVLDQVDGKIEKIEKTAKKSSRGVVNNFKSISSTVKMAAGAFGIFAAINIGKKMIQTAADFELAETRLKALYGSAEKASEVFNEFKAIAATTPFSLKEVVEGGINLKAFGLEADKTIKIAADLAAFMGVSVPEAASAMGRAFAAGAGAADILRERGVLTLIRDFQGIDDLSKLTLPEFRKAMLETFQEPTAGIAGATDEMSKTFIGSWSNMMDSIDKFNAKVGELLIPAINAIAKAVGSAADAMARIFEVEPQKAYIDILKENKRILDNIHDAMLSGINYQELENRLGKENLEATRATLGLKQLTVENIRAATIALDEEIKIETERLNKIKEEEERKNRIVEVENKILEAQNLGLNQLNKIRTIHNDLEKKSRLTKEQIAEQAAVLNTIPEPAERILNLFTRTEIKAFQTGYHISNTMIDGLIEVIGYGQNLEKTFKRILADVAAMVAKLLIIEGLKKVFSPFSLFGFQHGGSFTIGGHGGPDSQIVAFRGSPGEKVTVTPPGQVTNNYNDNPIFNINFQGNVNQFTEYQLRNQLIPILNKIIKERKVSFYATRLVT